MEAAGRGGRRSRSRGESEHTRGRYRYRHGTCWRCAWTEARGAAQTRPGWRWMWTQVQTGATVRPAAADAGAEQTGLAPGLPAVTFQYFSC